MRVNICWIGVAAWAGVVWGAAPERIAQVARGELKEARASWWGFDPSESTRTLQAAIDSRVPRLVVDKMPSPWIVDKLICVSGQEIVFEPGAEVLAKKGAFRGKSDALFSLIGVTNVTLRGPGAALRMRRADYDAPPYAKAEWRHVLNIKSSANIQVIGLTLAESGGDGIYLGSLRPEWPNRDIVIRDVICDRNYRQGISVISVENLLIENTVMRDTAGTPPAAGIDFEPNRAGERLKNCVMRNCAASGNEGCGFAFYLPNLTRASEPVSIRIENSRSENDRAAVSVTTGNADEAAVRGTMVFESCRFEHARRSGVTVTCKPAFGMALAFENCSVAGCMPTNQTPDIQLVNRKEDEWPVGGLRLDGMTVSQPVARPWVSWRNNTSITESPPAVTGRVCIDQNGNRREIEVTPAWMTRQFPPRFTVRVNRVTPDGARLRVTDRGTGLQPLSPMRVRRGGTYVFYGAVDQEVVLRGKQSRVGHYAESHTPLALRAPDGKVLKKIALPDFQKPVEVRFACPATGLYMLDVQVGANAFVLTDANVPVAIDATKKAVGLIGSAGSVFVSVPAGAGVFAFDVAGEGTAEAVAVSIADPGGTPVWTRDAVAEPERFAATEKQRTAGGLWQVSFGKPARGAFEDFHVDVRGVPGYLFLNAARFWSF